MVSYKTNTLNEVILNSHCCCGRCHRKQPDYLPYWMVLSWPLRLLPNPKLGHGLCYLFFCARALAHLVIVLIVASVVLATCGVKFCISLLPVTWLYTLIFIRVDSAPPRLVSLYANTCRYSVDSHLLRKLPNSPFKWVVTTVTATCSFLGLTRIRDMDVVLVVWLSRIDDCV